MKTKKSFTTDWYKAGAVENLTHFNVGVSLVHDAEVTGIYIHLIKWTLFIGLDVTV